MERVEDNKTTAYLLYILIYININIYINNYYTINSVIYACCGVVSVGICNATPRNANVRKRRNVSKKTSFCNRENDVLDS